MEADILHQVEAEDLHQTIVEVPDQAGVAAIVVVHLPDQVRAIRHQGRVAVDDLHRQEEAAVLLQGQVEVGDRVCKI